MPSRERDADDLVDVDDRPPRDRQHRSKSERKSDRDRPHRSSKSARSSRIGEGSDLHSSLVSSSKKQRKKDSDKDREKKEERDKERERDRGRDRDKEKDRQTDDRGKDREPRARSVSLSDLGEEALSRLSLDKDRISLPYPTLNKTHSRELVGSRDDISAPHKQPSNPLTPEPTDVGADEENRPKPQVVTAADPQRRSASTKQRHSRPPTPPETDLSADRRRLHDHSRVSKPSLSRSASHADDRSKVSRRSASSSQATFFRSPSIKVHDKIRSSVLRSSSMSSPRHSTSTKRSSSTRSSMKKSSTRPEPIKVDSSPSSIQDSSPKTPTQAPQFPSHPYVKRTQSPTASTVDSEPNLASKTATPAPPSHPPPPPPILAPPPPPAIDLHEAPRVDYLLQNGGLAQQVPKNFLSVLPPQNGPRPSHPPLAGADTLFTPFFNLLDQYQTVLAKQGSIAVATGHRSVARRLLDRLENVFSRDLPSHGCSCIICEKSGDIHQGLNWGDVLEWVSGRLELPQWPPFDLAEIGAKAAEVSGETPRRPESPVQLDPDIAEEFREHYLRQSKKVRSAVDRWLSNTGETPVPPPQEVDDETLCFAILTNLEAGDRPYFNALLTGSRELRPATRAPTPVHRSRTDLMVKTGLSLQRLYRLAQVPRDAECATYLIKNHDTHDLLVALSNINNSEWEILTSGRFDGFLWSGADAEDLGPGGLSRGPSVMGSRTTTPFSPYSRNPTPASFISLASSGMTGSRQPVSNDEEMEMAAIAEIEREVYTGMELLEDAFEKLHLKAEAVRTALRQRGAGLMQNLQMRRRIDVLPVPGSGDSRTSGYERPAWATGSEADAGSDNDWGLEDFELMPDDSASNISSSRHRRPKRRVERRTPAPIEEDDEER